MIINIEILNLEEKKKQILYYSKQKKTWLTQVFFLSGLTFWSVSPKLLSPPRLYPAPVIQN
jgi:hypothetical protein